MAILTAITLLLWTAGCLLLLIDPWIIAARDRSAPANTIYAGFAPPDAFYELGLVSLHVAAGAALALLAVWLLRRSNQVEASVES